MNIEIKKSKKPVKYDEAIKLLEERLIKVDKENSDELIWILEHEDIYTAGTSFHEDEIINKSTKVFKTNRGGKITYHGPGQLVCYFVINLKKREKDIRKFISKIEKTIIETLKFYKIETFADKNNIGIWYNQNYRTEKIGAIGLRISKWIAYHGFSININADLKKYNAIVPCGIKNKGVTNLMEICEQDYKDLGDILIKNFISNLEN